MKYRVKKIVNNTTKEIQYVLQCRYLLFLWLDCYGEANGSVDDLLWPDRTCVKTSFFSGGERLKHLIKEYEETKI